MRDLAGAIAARIASEVAASSGLDLGTVAAIDATALSLTVALPGGEVSGVRWVASYTPTVGDFVTVAKISGAWVVLGRLSKNLTGPGFQEVTIHATPSVYWVGTEWASDGEWDWMISTWITQGRTVFETTYWVSGGYAIFIPSAISLIPSGATVTACKLLMLRGTDEGMSLVAPSLYGHNRSAATAPTGPPSFVSGFGPWRPGQLTKGQLVSWDLPSTWLAALLSGAITGIGIYDTSAARLSDWEMPSMRLEITYTIPV